MSLKPQLSGALLLFWAIYGCTSPQENDTIRGYIMSREAGPSLINQCSRATPANVSDYWTPHHGHIDALENRLQSYWDSIFGALSAEQGRKLENYVRQYAGIVQDGSHRIYVNAFSAPEAEGARFRYPYQWHDTDLSRVAVSACDGGYAFWGVIYDLKAGTFHGFEFNSSF